MFWKNLGNFSIFKLYFFHTQVQKVQVSKKESKGANDTKISNIYSKGILLLENQYEFSEKNFFTLLEKQYVFGENLFRLMENFDVVQKIFLAPGKFDVLEKNFLAPWKILMCSKIFFIVSWKKFSYSWKIFSAFRLIFLEK